MKYHFISVLILTGLLFPNNLSAANEPDAATTITVITSGEQLAHLEIGWKRVTLLQHVVHFALVGVGGTLIGLCAYGKSLGDDIPGGHGAKEAAGWGFGISIGATAISAVWWLLRTFLPSKTLCPCLC